MLETRSHIMNTNFRIHNELISAMDKQARKRRIGTVDCSSQVLLKYANDNEKERQKFFVLDNIIYLSIFVVLSFKLC